MLSWLEEQPCLSENVKSRARGLIGVSGSKGVKKTLRELSEKGYVDKDNVDAWDKLRNRHVHPKLADLRVPDQAEYQELFRRLQRVGMLLHQLTFYLIGYEGPFTEYSKHGATRQYPLQAPQGAGVQAANSDCEKSRCDDQHEQSLAEGVQGTLDDAVASAEKPHDDSGTQQEEDRGATHH